MAYCVLVALTSCVTAPPSIPKTKKVTSFKVYNPPAPKQYKLIWTLETIDNSFVPFLIQGIQASTNDGKTWLTVTNNLPYKNGTNEFLIGYLNSNKKLYRVYWDYKK